MGTIRVRRLNFLANLLKEGAEDQLTFQVLQKCGPWAGHNSGPGQLWMGADYTSWADLVTSARDIERWRKAIRVKFPHIKNTPTNKKQAGKNSNFSSLLRPTDSSSYGAVVLSPDRAGAN